MAPLMWCCLMGIICMGSPACATTREGGKHRVVSLSASLSSFKREKGMKGHGKYEGMWKEGDMSGLICKQDP